MCGNPRIKVDLLLLFLVSMIWIHRLDLFNKIDNSLPINTSYNVFIKIKVF